MMDSSKLTIGFALTGSFCTFHKVFPEVQKLVNSGYDVIPIMSEMSYKTDTRFGTAEENRKKFESITGHSVICGIKEAEPIGPQKMLNALIIAPCTGNTIAKLAHGIADGTVTLSAKSHLRNKRPILIGVSTNDGLGANAKNIGILLARKYIYFVPFSQDDHIKKENSVVSDMELILPALESALNGQQIQPLLL
jgi:dipicolinate synthase subunit B